MQPTMGIPRTNKLRYHTNSFCILCLFIPYSLNLLHVFRDLPLVSTTRVSFYPNLEWQISIFTFSHCVKEGKALPTNILCEQWYYCHYTTTELKYSYSSLPPAPKSRSININQNQERIHLVFHLISRNQCNSRQHPFAACKIPPSELNWFQEVSRSSYSSGNLNLNLCAK